MSTKVLIVEDSPELCELIREVLIADGIEARGITDSAQAATCLMEEKFEAVFLDVHMPRRTALNWRGRCAIPA